MVDDQWLVMLNDDQPWWKKSFGRSSCETAGDLDVTRDFLVQLMVSITGDRSLKLGTIKRGMSPMAAVVSTDAIVILVLRLHRIHILNSAVEEMWLFPQETDMIYAGAATLAPQTQQPSTVAQQFWRLIYFGSWEKVCIDTGQRAIKNALSWYLLVPLIICSTPNGLSFDPLLTRKWMMCIVNPVDPP